VLHRWKRKMEACSIEKHLLSMCKNMVPAIEAGISSINRPHELRNEAQQ